MYDKTYYSPCSVHKTINVNQVHVHPTRYITLYIHTDPTDCPYDGKPAQIQVEVRVTKEGKLEVFSDEPIEVRPFTEWQP
jgi:hypothetical protein